MSPAGRGVRYSVLAIALGQGLVRCPARARRRARTGARSVRAGSDFNFVPGRVGTTGVWFFWWFVLCLSPAFYRRGRIARGGRDVGSYRRGIARRGAARGGDRSDGRVAFALSRPGAGTPDTRMPGSRARAFLAGACAGGGGASAGRFRRRGVRAA